MSAMPDAAPAPNIIEAMDGRTLFGRHFQGKNWDAWRVFLKALFGLEMDDEQLAIYRERTGRAEPPSRAFSEAALVIGRRGGKSRILALIATYLATFRNYDKYLAAGEMGTVAVVAADRKQARTVMRYIMGLLEQTPLLAPLIAGTTAESVTLSNRVMIEVHTASFRVTRGYTLVAALADEIAFWPTEDSATPDVEIIRAIRPGLASIPGSMLLMASSPYAKRGVLWQSYRDHFGKDDAGVLVWQAGTAAMNPRIDPEFIAAEREKDPESASAEYDALFRSDVSAFVAREVVDACTFPRRMELLPAAGIRYYAFVDPSGGSSDSMTLAIAHAQDGIAVLDAVRERRPPFSPEDVVIEFAALLKSYRITEVTGDRYAGEWPRERFSTHGVSYKISELSKGDIYRNLLPLLNSGKTELLDLTRLATQLCGLERRVARGGRDSIDHGPGGHDDLANAAAGGLLLVGAGNKPVVFSPAVLTAMAGMRFNRPRIS